MAVENNSQFLLDLHKLWQASQTLLTVAIHLMQEGAWLSDEIEHQSYVGHVKDSQQPRSTGQMCSHRPDIS